MVTGGETESSEGLRIYCGGKGLNQSVALARAGAQVYHGGLVGADGEPLLAVCRENGIPTDYIRQLEGPGGHTVIQVDRKGQNSILLYGGSNRQFTEDYIDEMLADFGKGDLLLLQNEVNRLDYMVHQAFARGMKIILNPSPMDGHLLPVELDKIHLFIMNEIEGQQMTGEKEPERILTRAAQLYPAADFVLTLGKAGSIYMSGRCVLRQKAYAVEAVDTTAAGDTFTGYFIAGMMEGLEPGACLELAARASALAVTRPGAVPSIPWRRELAE